MRELIRSHTIMRISENTRGFRIARQELDRHAALMFKNSF